MPNRTIQKHKRALKRYYEISFFLLYFHLKKAAEAAPLAIPYRQFVWIGLRARAARHAANERFLSPLPLLLTRLSRMSRRKKHTHDIRETKTKPKKKQKQIQKAVGHVDEEANDDETEQRLRWSFCNSDTQSLVIDYSSPLLKCYVPGHFLLTSWAVLKKEKEKIGTISRAATGAPFLCSFLLKKQMK